MQMGSRIAAHLLLVFLAQANLDPSSAEGSCDDLLRFAYPDLCELEITRGTLLVRNLTLVYWRYRNKHGRSDKVPMLMVHGGPGFSHDYILPMKQQACRGREIVFYDQVGAGESSIPVDHLKSAPWLLTIPYYNEEIQALVAKMGWDKFHYFGSSWGTVVGQSYGLVQDPRVQSITLSGPLSDGQLYSKSQWDPVQGNIGSMPLHVQDTLRKLEKAKEYDSTLYQADDQLLTSFFTTRTIPQPDCFKSATPSASGHAIYVSMQGPSEFTTGGVLAVMNFTPRLHEIEVPVLLTHGRYDTMRPPVIDAMYQSFPQVWRAQFPRSGHCSMIDDPRLMNDVIGDFVDHVESNSLESFAIPEEAKDPGDLPLTFSLSSSPGARAHLSQWLETPSLFVGIAIGMFVGACIPGMLMGVKQQVQPASASAQQFLNSEGHEYKIFAPDA